LATVIQSIGIEGIQGYPIAVQVKLLGGVPVMNIVGLGDQAIKEAKDRIESAFDHLGLTFPKKKIVVNLSPSDIRKRGTYLDLPMLIGLLIESEQLFPAIDDLDKVIFLGEVGLSGELNHFNGVLPMVIEAKNAGYKKVVVPRASLIEASRCTGIEILGFDLINQVLKWMERRYHYRPEPIPPLPQVEKKGDDYSEVNGHQQLLRFVTAAVAGSHNILLIGPAGCGKSMIAKRIPTIMPDLTEEEALEVMIVQSVAGVLGTDHGTMNRPFRAPHYRVSTNAIIGGGTYAKPGEISLAHNGVLFLDELPEYAPQTIEALRQPLEDRCVTVTRVRQSNTYPANFMLVAAMNPCKCGNFGTGHCICTPKEVKKYRHRISGPIYDRLDIQKYVNKVDFIDHMACTKRISSSEMKTHVVRVRQIQTKRFKGIGGLRTNSQISGRYLNEFCPLDINCTKLLEETFEKFGFSGRSFNKILCLARTFADLDESRDIRRQDIVSALLARDLDKENAQLL